MGNALTFVLLKQNQGAQQCNLILGILLFSDLQISIIFLVVIRQLAFQDFQSCAFKGPFIFEEGGSQLCSRCAFPVCGSLVASHRCSYPAFEKSHP